MNPLTNVRNVQNLNERELEKGISSKTSWHRQYKDSAWIFIGGLPYDLSEGDVIAVFSQYGEVVNINLVRDKITGKSKGFCFLCYEDQRSTILAVDNLNSIKLLGRTLRVDHCESYRQPKETGDEDDITKKLRLEGCAPERCHTPEVLIKSNNTDEGIERKKPKLKRHDSDIHDNEDKSKLSLDKHVNRTSSGLNRGTSSDNTRSQRPSDNQSTAEKRNLYPNPKQRKGEQPRDHKRKKISVNKLLMGGKVKQLKSAKS